MSAEQHLDVDWWPIDEPTPYAKNPRKLGQRAVAKVAASLEEFGWRQPLVVDEAGVILVGHTRLLAAKYLGQEQVPVHVARGLSAAQAKAYRIADNRTAAENEWDLELLPLEIADLKAMDADLALLGFEGDELTALLAIPPTAGLTDPDAAPEPPEAPTSRSGDLWLLGGHRLLCGDATSPDDVRRLMDGQRAVGMFTDPPYLVDYNASHHPQSHANDPLVKDKDWDAYRDPESSVAFYADFLRAALQEALSERAAIYQCFAILRSEIIWQAWRALDLLPHQVVIWHKSRGVLTHSWYMWNYEPLLIGWRQGKQPTMKPPANATTVWEIDSKIEDNPGSIHPTMKPVELIRRPILYHTKRGGLIYEPFSGSGTAIIAAEATGYLYDVLNHLTSEHINGGSTTTYAYDAVGNRTSMTVGGTTTTYSCDDASELLAAGSTTYGYDNNGSRTVKIDGSQTTNYGWNSDNLLSSVTVGQHTTSYLYNGENQRVATTENDNGTETTTNFVLDTAASPDVVLQETTGEQTTTYTYGLGLISRQDSDGIRYLLTDGNGSVRLETNVGGSVTASHTYDAFGNESGSPDLTGNRFRFAGQWADQAGLTFMRARFYEPETGAFLSVDPQPSASSPYAYCADNPLVAIDPSGQSWVDTLAAGGKGFVNFCAGATNALTCGLLHIGQPFHGAGLDLSYSIGEGTAIVASAAAGAWDAIGSIGAARTLADAVDISTAGRTPEEAAAITEYAARSNAWLAENGPQTIRSTDGALHAEANAAARAERLAAERAGAPYRAGSQVGHVPDTAITGQASPPGGWLDMPGFSNQVCGGVLGSRVGQTISRFTVDGMLP